LPWDDFPEWAMIAMGNHPLPSQSFDIYGILRWQSLAETVMAICDCEVSFRVAIRESTTRISRWIKSDSSIICLLRSTFLSKTLLRRTFPSKTSKMDSCSWLTKWKSW
jgi:hypothetical protein